MKAKTRRVGPEFPSRPPGRADIDSFLRPRPGHDRLRVYSPGRIAEAERTASAEGHTLYRFRGGWSAILSPGLAGPDAGSPALRVAAEGRD